MSQLRLSDALADAIEASDIGRIRDLWAETEIWLSGEVVDDWVPTLSASTTDPTLGGGTEQQDGMYRVMLGNMVFGQFHIRFGTSGNNKGSGVYLIDLPFKPVTLPNDRGTVIGTVAVFDNGGVMYDGHLDVAPAVSTTAARMILTGWPKEDVTDLPTTAGTVTDVTPFTWSTQDLMRGTFMYIAEDLVI